MTPVPATATGLADEIRAAASGRDRLIMGIAGAPGAGKSTLAERLVALLSGAAVLIPMDGFHLADRVLHELGRRDDKGGSDTYDVNGYLALLRRLRQQHEDVIYAPTFRRDLEEPIAASVAVPRRIPIVITEGNYLLLDVVPWSEIRDLLDIACFVDIDHDTRVQRLVERHHAFGKPIEAARKWAEGSDERNAALVDRSRHRADSIVWLTPEAGQVHATRPVSSQSAQ